MSKYIIKQFPNYLNEVLLCDVATESNFKLISSFKNLNCSFWNQFALSLIGPAFREKTLESC